MKKTVYELIQELSQFPADSIVMVSVPRPDGSYENSDITELSSNSSESSLPDVYINLD